MTKNAIGTHRQTLQPSTHTSPSWCVRHGGYDAGTPDEVVIRYGPRRNVSG